MNTSPNHPFEPGDKVECINSTGSLRVGDTFTIQRIGYTFICPEVSTMVYSNKSYIPYEGNSWDISNFKLIEPTIPIKYPILYTKKD